MTRLLDSLGTVTEDLDRLAPHPSFIWPETRVLAGNARYAENPPAKTVLADADLISGLIVGAADHTVAWLEDLIRSQRKRRICLVLVLFPAGPTREEHLSQIVTLAEKGLVSGQTLEVRLLPLADCRPGRHTKRAPRSDSLSASQALAALGWERLSSRKLPASPKSRIIIESFPLSAWGSLCKAAPGQGKNSSHGPSERVEETLRTGPARRFKPTKPRRIAGNCLGLGKTCAAARRVGRMSGCGTPTHIRERHMARGLYCKSHASIVSGSYGRDVGRNS